MTLETTFRMVSAMLLKHKPTREQNPLDSVVPWVTGSSVELATPTPCGVAGAAVVVMDPTAVVIGVDLAIGSVAMVATPLR